MTSSASYEPLGEMRKGEVLVSEMPRFPSSAGGRGEPKDEELKKNRLRFTRIGCVAGTERTEE
jgi:hypothetical protein